MTINIPFLFMIRNKKIPKNHDLIFMYKIEEINNITNFSLSSFEFRKSIKLWPFGVISLSYLLLILIIILNKIKLNRVKTNKINLKINQ